jgi:glycosyltransferase involved in cell wall biosynthesis
VELVTIAIPTYKRLSYLKEAVESALRQTYTTIEIIIGQDPTPEGLDPAIKEWCIKAAVRDKRIKYNFNHHNLGLAGNWNQLAQLASGQSIIIIGDDDRLLPNCIEVLLRGIQNGAEVSFANHLLIDSNGKVLASSHDNTKYFNRASLPQGFLVNPEKVIWENAVPVSCSLINTSFVKRLKFKADLNTPEIELFLRMNQEQCKFFFTPDYLAEYRVHSQSATSHGLRVQHLMKYLIPFPVSSANQKFKDNFLEKLVRVSVNNFLYEKNKSDAWKIFFSKYGIKNLFTLKGFLQLIMFAIPSSTIHLILSKKK